MEKYQPWKRKVHLAKAGEIGGAGEVRKKKLTQVWLSGSGGGAANVFFCGCGIYSLLVTHTHVDTDAWLYIMSLMICFLFVLVDEGY